MKEGEATRRVLFQASLDMGSTVAIPLATAFQGKAPGWSRAGAHPSLAGSPRATQPSSEIFGCWI